MAAKHSTLTQERLKELLHYDPDTGIFTRLTAPSPRNKIGDIAGSNHGDGYLEIQIDKVTYLAHRLAWLYVYGNWPEKLIDHMNGNGSDNRIENLRDVSQHLNQQNLRKSIGSSKTGLLGAYPHAIGFQAMIRVAGKLICLGTFGTKELAHAAYIDAKRLHHPGCTI